MAILTVLAGMSLVPVADIFNHKAAVVELSSDYAIEPVCFGDEAGSGSEEGESSASEEGAASNNAEDQHSPGWHALAYAPQCRLRWTICISEGTPQQSTAILGAPGCVQENRLMRTTLSHSCQSKKSREHALLDTEHWQQFPCAHKYGDKLHGLHIAWSMRRIRPFMGPALMHQ